MTKINTGLPATPLPLSFYQNDNVTVIAKSLIGKILVTQFNHQLTAGRIVETEAYNGIADRASHAYGGRRTSRTEVMYAAGGCAYVYLCYGMHHLFNVVTGAQELPHAVLIRALEAVAGIDIMLCRTKKKMLDDTLTKGPGNVSKALGIDKKYTGWSLVSKEIFIADDGFSFKKDQIIATARIGVGYAGGDALLPYRFIVKDHPCVCGKKISYNLIQQPVL